MKENQWLTNIMGIQEGIPYHGKLTSGEEMPGDASLEDMATHAMNGIAIFKMKDGWLHFDFTGDENTHYLAQSVIAKSPAPVIAIPGIGFTGNFVWSILPGDDMGMGGVVSGKDFGDENVHLDGVYIEVNAIPNWTLYIWVV